MKSPKREHCSRLRLLTGVGKSKNGALVLAGVKPWENIDMSAATGKRAANRIRMEGEIRRAAKDQLAQVGPANLSLREVARALDVAPSAVYRYVKDRDALLNLLLQDAYNELAKTTLNALAPNSAVPSTVQQSVLEGPLAGDSPLGDDLSGASLSERDSLPGRADLTGRIEQFALVMRQWAIAHPHEWALLYGTPVPGFNADADVTTAPGTRLLRWLAETLVEHAAPRTLPSNELDAAHPLVTFAQEAAVEFSLPIDPQLLVHALHIWHCIIGAVSAEVFAQLGPTPPGLGEHLLRAIVAEAVHGRGPIRHNGTRD